MISIARVMGLLAGSHAAAHPVRTVLTVIGVALGVSAPIAIDLANRDVLRAFQRTVVEVAGTATLEVSAGDLGFNEDVIRSVRSTPDVLSALPIVQRTVRDVQSAQGLTLVGTDLFEVAVAKRLRWSGANSNAPANLLRDDQVFVGRRLADAWGAKVGDRRSLDFGSGIRSVTIGGVLEAEQGLESIWNTVAVMDIAPAQELFEFVGRLDRIDIVTRPSATIAEVQRQVEHRLPYGVSVRRPVQRGEQVESMVAAFRLNLLMLSAVGLLIGGFLIFNTLSFSVVQRRRDIGILRAIGLSERGVLALFLAEGAGYGVIGGVLGSVAGALLSETLVGMVGRNITELYAVAGGAPRQTLTVRSVAPIIMQGMALGTLVSMIGAWGPSREAGRTEIVGALALGGYELATLPQVGRGGWIGAALLVLSAVLALLPGRGEVPVFGYLSVLGLLLGLSAMAPVLVVRLCRLREIWMGRRPVSGVSIAGLAASAASRAPHRNGVTVSSLLVGLAIMVGVIIMIRSFRHTVELWIDQTVIADVIVTPAGWLRAGHDQQVERLFPRRWADAIEALPGVAAVDTYRHVAVELAGRPRALVARDLRLHAEFSRYLFVRGESRDVLIRTVADQGVIVSEVLAGALGLSEGDDVVLTTPAGPKAFPVRGIFYDYATDGGKIVMDRALFLASWGDAWATVIPVYLKHGEDAQAVGQRIERVLAGLDGSSLPFAVVANADLRREILAIFDRTFRVTYVLEIIAIVIAMFGMVNTLLTAALERRRELATLQALGASEGQVVGLLLWEAGYLGVLGGLLGLIGGVWLAAVLVWVINKQSFGWTIPLSLPGGVLAMAPALALLTALAAAYWPARWIARQPAVEGLRYE